MYLKFWGTRGSIPVPGKNTIKYGGNTPCVEVRSANDKLLIFDGGSGIRELGNHLMKSDFNDVIKIFLTHYHWDHIQGIPFFIPLYRKNTRISFYGLTINEYDSKNFLSVQMTPHNFPIKLEDVSASISFHNICADSSFTLEGIQIETIQINHSSPTLTYKLIENGKKIIYMTDNELDSVSSDIILEPDLFIETNKKLIEFCKDADYLIHDTMYDEKSIATKKGWGHSSNISLALFSILANVKNLVLFHYNPDHTDDKIDQLLAETNEILKENNSNINCIAASEGLEIII